MILLTKSIQKVVENKDGIRICIMRRIKPEFIFDMWMPSLAPSTQLLKEYQENQIDWEIFQKRYSDDILKNENTSLIILQDILKHDDVTLLCWEENPEHCHRRLVAEKLLILNPSQPTLIR